MDACSARRVHGGGVRRTSDQGGKTGQRGSPRAVTLATVYQAKGNEWDTVFIAHANDGNMPKKPTRPKRSGGVRYVAMTRARRQLFVTWHRRTDQSFDGDARGSSRRAHED